MQTRFNKATSRLSEARAETTAASAADIQAKERLRSLTDRLSDPELPERERQALQEHADEAMAQAERAGRAAAAASSRFMSASTAWREARRDYDATRRGLADLQAAQHSATTPAEQESLHERAGNALDRIQQDEDMRSQRWGTPRSQYVLPTVGLADADDNVRSRISPDGEHLAHRASATRGADGTVTYTFYSDENSKGVSVNVHQGKDEPTPSLGAVMTSMKHGARAHREASNFTQYCKNHNVDRSDPQSKDAARAAYDAGKSFDREGARIFGRDTWDEIVSGR